jgi:hypothetical protein
MLDLRLSPDVRDAIDFALGLTVAALPARQATEELSSRFDLFERSCNNRL